MRQAVFLSHALLFWSAAQALPFGLDHVLHIEKRHVAVETIERRNPQGLLDTLSSIGNDISSAFSPQSTQTLNSGSAATRSSSDDDDETTSTQRSTSTRSSSESTSTSTRRSTATSTEESSSTTETASSETTSSTTEESTTSTASTTSESSTTPPTPVETAPASATPQPSKDDGGSNVPVAGIAVGVVLGVAVLAVIVFILFKWGPLAKWRENRAYEKMMERTYRPALDDKSHMGFDDGSNPGLGLAPMGAATVAAGAAAMPPNGGYRGVRPTNNAASTSPTSLAAPPRAFSFGEERAAVAEKERVRRKPLPTIGTGGGVEGQSPLMSASARTPTGAADGTEPWLPGGAK